MLSRGVVINCCTGVITWAPSFHMHGGDFFVGLPFLNALGEQTQSAPASICVCG